MKTFREYLSISQFEDIWSEIVENYLEPEEIKSVYAKYYEKLKALPHKSVRGIIDMPGSPNQYPDGLNGAPDWIIEIVSPGSRAMDYYTKLSLYREAGVREYWIVDPARQTILTYDMEQAAAPVIYSFADTVKATVLDDLVINFSKLK